MKPSSDLRAEDLISVSRRPVTLTGDPDALSGAIELINKGETDIWVPTLTARFDKDSGLPGNVELDVNTMVPAAGQIVAEASLELAGSVLPGRYTGKLVVGDETTAVELTIDPLTEVEFRPDTLSLEAKQAGEVLEASVQVANLGNTSVKLAEIEVEQTLTGEEVVRLLTKAARRKGGEGTMPVLDSFVESLQETLQGELEIEIAEANKTVEPGCTADLNLRVTVPRDPANSRILRGQIQLEEATLAISVRLL